MEKVQLELKKNHEELLKFHELYLKQQEMMKEIQSGAMNDVRATKELLVELQKQTGDLVQIQRDHEESLNNKLMELEDNKARRHAELINQLKVNQQVLSRITQEVEDGWFYGVQVVSVNGENVRVSYNSKIIDVKMADIVKLTAPDQPLEAEATVIARHPHYQQTYAPGVIVCAGPLQIRFYDGTESIIPKAEVHLVDFERFEDFVDNIIQLESRWVNESVVARDDKTGVYKLGKEMGTVKERVANAHEYVIEWRGDNISTIQHYSCIFGKYSKAKSLQTGDHVIACSDKKSWNYHPGTITKADSNSVDIDFICNVTIEGANPKEAFYITPEYFNLAKEYYLAQLEGSTASSESSLSSVDN
ncbi:Oidioi.mRNA.OKI2018_I69.PAR.g11176.t1.cds [Oikopleura dioica]|uniref:Oidioi.mRNA.OKI2018_I69.PAR.g11176.t1.cds n=1 Tax=Oikopleura dioica TaxID=34765 RepID=A0ABN7RXQ7_OIKDI|nr:Oidioi.mRNA.OKI2018_I69.PAR.g11176.t1.cds [Oikopleura dioica]